MLNVGDTAPDFELLNQDRQPVRLSDYRGKRVVLFTFHRAGTAGCTKQACALRDALPRIEASNTIVLAVSDDTPEALQDWKARERLPYDLLSDPGGAILDQIGATHAAILSLKLPIRPHALWVFDENGIVRAAHAPLMLEEAASRALKILASLPEPIT